MNNYYFKIKTPAGKRYCCFTAESEQKARRNALFACFAAHEEDENEIILKYEYPTADQRYAVLNVKYGDRIEVTDEQTYLKKDEKQYD
jgi:hypothetical protein